MREIAEGTADAHTCLAGIADLVREDMQIMSENAETMRSELGLTKTEGGSVHKEKAEGHWSVTDEDVHFNRSWGGHRFTDEEISLLLSGKEIAFSATSKAGKSYDVFGKLAKQKYNGHAYVGFEKLGFGKKDANGELLPPSSWCQHVFTKAEIARLVAGEGVEADDFVSRKGNAFQTVVYFKDEKGDGNKRIVPDFNAQVSSPPRSWGGHTFSTDEKRALAAGKPVHAEDLVSKKGKKYKADLSWIEEDGRKKIVPAFA
jgi:DNA topoisomerase-3